VVNTIETRLRGLNLRDPPDRRHLAEAIAIGAAWFITLDKDIIKKTRGQQSQPTKIEGVIVGRPSELRAKTTFDPVFGLRLAEGSPTPASTEARDRVLT
jgi:predicted nucleic acid-binding protein